LTFSFGAKEFKFKDTNVHFQAQITFTKENTKYLRVISRSMPISRSRDQIENHATTSLVALKAVQESASLAQKGDYQKARINLISHQRLLQRAMKSKEQQFHYINYIKQSEKLDGFMREAQQQDEIFGSKMKDERKLQRDDSSAKNIIQMKSVHRKIFAESQSYLHANK